MAKEINEISRFIKNMKFKRKFFGGIDEVDAWNKIEKLNSEYKELFDNQQIIIKELREKLNEK